MRRSWVQIPLSPIMQDQNKSIEAIFNIDHSHECKNRTWWWWWLIFFLDDEMQLMVLWATRNTKKMVINDHIWLKKIEEIRRKNEIEFFGLTASWFFDGENMYDPLFIADGKHITRWSNEQGEIGLINDKTISKLEWNTDKKLLYCKTGDTKIELELQKWTDVLNEVVHTGKKFFGNLGYSMEKVRGMKVNGKIEIKGTSTTVKGTAYFQKVRISSPTSPWYWGIIHTEEGCYMDYFMPHIGFPMFRRKDSHKSFLDFGEKYLSRSFQFVEKNGTVHRWKKIKIKRKYENDLPIFTLEGSEPHGEFRIVLCALARACWIVSQPWLKYGKTVLHYNEYPITVEEFTLKSKELRINQNDLGKMTGNCEHAWGII